LSDCLVSPDVFHQIAAPGKFHIPSLLVVTP
jgi:hypothetical protein